MSTDERLMDLAWSLSMAGIRRAGFWVSLAALHLGRGDVDECQERLTRAFDACNDRAWRNRIQEESELLT